ncbi:MAG TPA: xanthine dehydrogenase family protein subunit M [Armatimonadetes bacterium]|nr:xanthine dehydrogenase family protein subunit M [Armatimonadota bacterium]
MARFEYFAPTSIEEVIRLLQEHGKEAKVLAGGTDLLVFMRDGRVKPRWVIDLTRVEGWAYLTETEEGGVRIGAMTTLREIEISPLLQARYTALVQGAREVGSVQIRNRATLGGNLCTSSPAADTPPSLLTFDATVRLRGPAGERLVALSEFFTGPGENVLQPAEVLVEVLLPPLPPRTGSHYLKLSTRRALDLAFVGVAARVTLAEEGETLAEVRLGLGAVAPTPRRVEAVEELLRGQPLTEETLARAAKVAQAAVQPITDVRASAEYRRAMVGVLTKRALQRAYAAAQNQA